MTDPVVYEMTIETLKSQRNFALDAVATLSAENKILKAREQEYILRLKALQENQKPLVPDDKMDKSDVTLN